MSKGLIAGVTGLVFGCLVPLGFVLVPALPRSVDDRVARADRMFVEVGFEDSGLLKHEGCLLGVYLVWLLRPSRIDDLYWDWLALDCLGDELR